MESSNSGTLDDAQIALLNVIVKRLIPSDEHGPGACEAHAARYILDALAGDYRRYLPDYMAGLADLDARAQAAYGMLFVSLDSTRQDSLLTDIEHRETIIDGPTPRSFFDLVLKHTREGVFGDPRWGGNADRVGWLIIGYGGPKLSWAAEDQRLEFIEQADQ